MLALIVSFTSLWFLSFFIYWLFYHLFTKKPGAFRLWDFWLLSFVLGFPSAFVYQFIKNMF